MKNSKCKIRSHAACSWQTGTRIVFVTCAGTASAIACMSVADDPLRQNVKSLGMNMNKNLCSTTGTLICLWLALLFVPIGNSQTVDQTFDLFQTKTALYSNVTVTTKSAKYIVIQHSSGLASLKIADLSPEHHEALGYGVVKGYSPPSSSSCQLIRWRSCISRSLADTHSMKLARPKRFRYRG